MSTRPIRRVGGLVVVAAVVTGVALYANHWWVDGRFVESTDDAYVSADVVTMAPKVAGLIATVAVTDNQAVRAGDLLVKLDDRDYRAALAKAEAAVASQRATLANLEAVRRVQLSTIDQARASLNGADAETVRTRSDQARHKQLSEAAVTSVETFERADAIYKQAVASEQRATASLDAARRQVDVIDTTRRQAEASLASAIAERDKAALDLESTEIRSPVDGVVGNRSARLGAYATVGAQLMAIVPSTGLWIDANFKESQLARMHEGLAVEIEADVLPGEIFHGRVMSLAPATGSRFSVLPAENATGNFTKIVQRVPVRVALDGDAALLGRLRPGLSVNVHIDTRAEEAVASASRP